MNFIIFNVLFALFYAAIDYSFEYFGFYTSDLSKDIIYYVLNIGISTIITSISMFKLKDYIDF